jgi:hypothetical protein
MTEDENLGVQNRMTELTNNLLENSARQNNETEVSMEHPHYAQEDTQRLLGNN